MENKAFFLICVNLTVDLEALHTKVLYLYPCLLLAVKL